MYKPNSQPDNKETITDNDKKKSNISFEIPKISSIDTPKKQKSSFPIGGPIGSRKSW